MPDRGRSSKVERGRCGQRAASFAGAGLALLGIDEWGDCHRAGWRVSSGGLPVSGVGDDHRHVRRGDAGQRSGRPGRFREMTSFRLV